ncbi:hypothetical protein EJD97_012670 [Solanum chilense]|uniref:Uncharacterized protein n=1 Tax=Solanum chilense TaxID=4083 RepID=A0A6N2BCN2_SOLCI|nr:hypothetical protein EJD97_012670 [Solanum chilense]
MIDILPDCLIQKILCCLSFKEATRMSILSKTWLQEWSTLPNLEFTINCWEGNINTANTTMERYRKGKIPIQKFELVESFANSREDFPLIDKWLDIALENGVKHLSLNFKSYPMPILRILAAKSLRGLDVQGSMPDSLSSGVVNCKSLRKLSLSNIRLDENIVQTLLNSCPFIDSLILGYCSGKFINCCEIKMKDLLMDHIGSTPRVDVLNVNIEWMNQNFVDALLWSCHPRRLNLFSNVTPTITYFIDHLLFMMNSSHSTSDRSLPWHSQLKEIKVFDGKNQSLPLISGELAKKIRMEGEKIYFLLDWCS